MLLSLSPFFFLSAQHFTDTIEPPIEKVPFYRAPIYRWPIISWSLDWALIVVFMLNCILAADSCQLVISQETLDNWQKKPFTWEANNRDRDDNLLLSCDRFIRYSRPCNDTWAYSICQGRHWSWVPWNKHGEAFSFFLFYFFFYPSFLFKWTLMKQVQT